MLSLSIAAIISILTGDIKEDPKETIKGLLLFILTTIAAIRGFYCSIITKDLLLFGFMLSLEVLFFVIAICYEWHKEGIKYEAEKAAYIKKWRE